MKRGVLILIYVFVVLACYGQNDESFDSFRQNMLSGMSQFKDSVMTEYKEFRRRINADYAELLRGVWKDEKAQPTLLPIKEPVPLPPVVMPEEDRDKQIQSNPIIIEEEITPTPPIPQPEPVVPIEEEAPTPIRPIVTHTFDFYGTSLQVRLSPTQRFIMKSTEPKTMGNVWERLSQDDYTNLLYDCLSLRQQLDLCDWAYLQMVHKLSESFLGEDTNESIFMTAYIFCQSGYRIRIGESQGRIYLLVGTLHHVYKRGYFVIDGLNYFVLNANPKSLHVCNAEFEGEQSLSLYMPKLPRLKESTSASRTLKSERYPEFHITSNINQNLLPFFNDYPTSYVGDNVCSQWAIYAETPMSSIAERTLVSSLRSKLTGLSEDEALNRLLNFVQTAFVYEYDDKVWGDDRAFFPDETLYYPYCDCEDRSILFSRLVRELLGLKVMLVLYPGHLATAVCVNKPMNGDYIIFENKRFIVCDPTYIGAPVGTTMDKMDNQKAKVIILN